MMYVVTCAVVVFMYALIILLFENKILDADKIKERKDELTRINDKRREYNYIDETLSKPFTERVIKPLLEKLGTIITRFIPIKSKDDEKIKRQLEQSGYSISSNEYLIIQLLSMIGGGALGVVYGVMTYSDITSVFIYFILGVFSAYTLLRSGLT